MIRDTPPKKHHAVRRSRKVAWVWLQHARVARAVRQRNPDAAQRRLEAHMQASMNAALEAYDARRGDRVQPAAHPPQLTEAMNALIAELRGSAR